MWGSAVGGIATLLLSLLILPCPSQAQRPPLIPRVGFIHPTLAVAGSDIFDAFRQGLHDLGYVEGETITLEGRWAEGVADRLPTLISFETRDHRELEYVLARLEQDEAEALLVLPDPLFGFHRRRLVEFAAHRRWPSMFFNREYAAAGGSWPTAPISLRPSGAPPPMWIAS
jgi:hypothetical protein